MTLNLNESHLGTLQVLKSPTWLVAPILLRKHIYQHTKFYGTELV